MNGYWRTRSPRPIRSSGDPGPRLLRLELLEDRRLLAGRAADAINQFALDVYQQMQREDGNLFFSPLSIASGLAMAYAGAAGPTAAEMEQVLHFGTEPGIHASFGELLDSIKSHNEVIGGFLKLPHVLTVANAIWPDDGLSVEPGFLDVIQDDYDGHVQSVDYDNSQQAKEVINQWVSNQTKGKIPQLVNDLDSTVRMVLTNAVYFNGYWESPFDPRYSGNGTFTLQNGQTIVVPKMYTEMNAHYAAFNGFAVLELPFAAGLRGADYSMVFVLPPENGADDLTPELFTQIDAWLDGPQQEHWVVISLPKIDLAVSTSLNQLLIGLGMPKAFTLGEADFSAMTPEEVAISRVFHKATLTMNEQGTTAAAATEIDFVICFAAGTPVMTPQGAKLIEELKEGDLVLARDEHNLEGELQPKRVEKVHHRNAEILELKVRGRTIRTTSTHPFFVRGKGWTPAGDLQPRDRLSTDKGDWAEVDSVRLTHEPEPVYNLRVADFHTYFVGREEWQFAVWAHNACGGEPEFRADRPFHVLIRDNITSTIAFMGRIDDPLQLQNDVTPVVVEASADFDGNLIVDGADFLAWQCGNGTAINAARTDGDSDQDGDADASDFAQWKQTFGQATAPLARAAGEAETRYGAPIVPDGAIAPAEYIDAAMALEWLTPDSNDETPLVADNLQQSPLVVAPSVPGEGPVPAAATAIVFDSLADEEASADDTEFGGSGLTDPFADLFGPELEF